MPIREQSKMKGRELETRTSHFKQNKSFQVRKDFEGKHTNLPSRPLPFLPKMFSKHSVDVDVFTYSSPMRWRCLGVVYVGSSGIMVTHHFWQASLKNLFRRYPDQFHQYKGKMSLIRACFGIGKTSFLLRFGIVFDVYCNMK